MLPRIYRLVADQFLEHRESVDYLVFREPSCHFESLGPVEVSAEPDRRTRGDLQSYSIPKDRVEVPRVYEGLRRT